MEKKKYPIRPEQYAIYEEVGEGVSASVHRALCIPFDEIVAIKILDFERANADLNNISREAQTMILIDHPNVLRSHCSFVSDHNLWVVMPYMAGGSCLHILKAAYPDGIVEVAIATILREVLKGLEYLHQHGHIHRDVKAGNILIDSGGAIKLGDFGVSACLFDSGDRQRTRNTFVGTPCWMAPEVMEQLHGYDCKADIWSFGITALELAHGHAPFSKYPPMKVLLMTLQNAPPGLDYDGDKKFSKSFKQMVASCLVKDPSKRPSAKKLLKHSFFKQGRSSDYIARKLLDGLPALGDRMQALKKKEEDMLAQKKMPDGEKEELSQIEYKRGISSWNFDLEDMKTQAPLIPEDEIILDKDLGESTNSSSRLDNNKKQFEHQFSFSCSFSQHSESEESEPIQCQLSALQSVNSFGNFNNIDKNSDDDATITGSNHDQSISYSCSTQQGEHVKDSVARFLDIETMERAVDDSGAHSHRRSASSSACTNMPEIFPATKEERGQSLKQPQNLSGCNGGPVIHLGDDTPDLTPKASKSSSANSDEVDDKARIQVMQRKGRFEVSSGGLSPILQKSHSLQVITAQSPSSSLSSNSECPSNFIASSLFPVLQSFLQTNITQRESILSLMKQMSAVDFIVNYNGDGGSTPTNIATTEKSLLEIAHEREKELLQEITELQWRLICSQEELQKLKTVNAHVNMDTPCVQKSSNA
ncbi:hypothetical protein Nepgr_015971 [Nepenthes gracilis]|uniref:Protein kinase domain-containing protein n=1 Tax=Nepenthes gracilis TaxID=150966 RepID=A0AAD3XS39_NEPGR|nr:hypothetical protein Nepgr_015971 [Nepenthes gracilis]